MKTILIAHNYSEVSFASMSYHFSHYLAESGHHVVFISHKPYFATEREISIGKGKVTVLSWPTQKRPTSLKDFIWFAKLYFRFRPKIIIGHFVGSNISIMLSKLFSFGTAKTFEYYHTLSTQLAADQKHHFVKSRLLYWRKKLFYSVFCDVIVCPSKIAKNDVEKLYQTSKAIVLLNPIADRWHSVNASADAKIVISYLGRLDASKGVLDMVDAFNDYKSNNIHSKIILRIAGNGSEAEKIKTSIRNNKSIEFLGALAYDKIDKYLADSHYAIIPSKNDNLPTVGLEAMMNHTPLLISNATGLTDYLEDGEQCYTFEPDKNGISDVFERVENNFENHSDMSEQARATFLKLFTIDAYCTDFHKLLSL